MFLSSIYKFLLDPPIQNRPFADKRDKLGMTCVPYKSKHVIAVIWQKEVLQVNIMSKAKKA